MKVSDRLSESIHKISEQNSKNLGRPYLHVRGTVSEQQRIKNANYHNSFYDSVPCAQPTYKNWNLRPRNQCLELSRPFFTMKQNHMSPVKKAADDANYHTGLQFSKKQKLRSFSMDLNRIKATDVMPSLHDKSYFKTAQEICLDYGQVANMANDKAHFSHFFETKVNLEDPKKSNETIEERMERYTYHQAKRGRSSQLDVKNLTRTTLQMSNYVRSPSATKAFLRKDSGSGGCGGSPVYGKQVL